MHLTSHCFLIVRDWVCAPDPLGLLSAHCTLVFKSDRFLAFHCYGVRLVLHADVIWVTLDAFKEVVVFSHLHNFSALYDIRQSIQTCDIIVYLSYSAELIAPKQLTTCLFIIFQDNITQDGSMHFLQTRRARTSKKQDKNRKGKVI